MTELELRIREDLQKQVQEQKAAQQADLRSFGETQQATYGMNSLDGKNENQKWGEAFAANNFAPPPPMGGPNASAPPVAAIPQPATPAAVPQTTPPGVPLTQEQDFNRQRMVDTMLKMQAPQQGGGQFGSRQRRFTNVASPAQGMAKLANTGLRAANALGYGMPNPAAAPIIPPPQTASVAPPVRQIPTTGSFNNEDFFNQYSGME